MYILGEKFYVFFSATYRIIKKIKTSGDIFKDKKLSEIGGKKLFCKEIEASLLNNEIDLVINTTEGKQSIEDSSSIRQSALRSKTFCTTYNERI